jgi:CubicO group peptidase (beta-lactamase class C family)
LGIDRENMKKNTLIIIITIVFTMTIGYMDSASGHVKFDAYIKYQKVDNRINAWMRKEKVPGLAACIIIGDKVVWSNGYGWANIEKDVSFTPDDTLFQIASVSKTITATAVMQLRDKGLFKLDDDVNKFLPFSVRNPKYPNKPITFRHLLTHTSSIQDNDFVYSTYSEGDPVITLEKYITEYFTCNGLYWTKKNYSKYCPGEEENYSNVGFGLLGYLIETISRKPLETYLQENIYVPLCMLETSFYITDIDAFRHAIPYTYARKHRKKLIDEGDGLLLPEGTSPRKGFNGHVLYSYPTLSDGLIRTSVHQLARFMIAYMNGGSYNGQCILKTKTVEEMLSVQFGKEQGLGWFKSGSRWGHDGSDPGCAAGMLFDPKSKIGIIILCNADVDELTPVVKLLFSTAMRML